MGCDAIQLKQIDLLDESQLLALVYAHLTLTRGRTREETREKCVKPRALRHLLLLSPPIAQLNFWMTVPQTNIFHFCL
jgi:hypothetical protein